MLLRRNITCPQNDMSHEEIVFQPDNGKELHIMTSTRKSHMKRWKVLETLKEE